MKTTKRIKPLGLHCKLNKDSYLRNKARHHSSIEKKAQCDSNFISIINRSSSYNHRYTYRKYLVAGEKNIMTIVDLSIRESEKYIISMSRIPSVFEKIRKFANTGVRCSYIRIKYTGR